MISQWLGRLGFRAGTGADSDRLGSDWAFSHWGGIRGHWMHIVPVGALYYIPLLYLPPSNPAHTAQLCPSSLEP